MSRPPYNVTGAYEAFLEEFRRVAALADQTILSPDVPLLNCFRPSGDKTATFETFLYLKGWPCKKISRGKRLDVLIKVLETLKKLEPVSGNSWRLMESIVRLNYIVVSGSTARLAQSLHFDFVEGGRTDHPIFHVQLTAEPIPTDELRRTGFDLELELPGQANVSPLDCWTRS